MKAPGVGRSALQSDGDGVRLLKHLEKVLGLVSHRPSDELGGIGRVILDDVLERVDSLQHVERALPPGLNLRDKDW